MKELLRALVSVHGPSGHEDGVRKAIAAQIGDGVDELRTDVMGNLIAVRRATSGSGSGAHKVMIAAHMDEIGLIVTHIDKWGFARFARVGGVRPDTLIGGRVRFMNGVIGVVGWEKWLQSTDQPKWGELFVDTGATCRDDAPISVGDVAAFERPFETMGDRWVSKAMDDRVGCAIALRVLQNLPNPANDVYFCFTAQEEVGTRGATVSAFGIEPDIAVAIDVTDTGDTPEAHPMDVRLGGGPAIKVKDSGMLTHPGVKNWMVEGAKAAGVPYQLEVLELGSTDARAIQLSRAGVPAGCLSIPCRYVHTPSEVVDAGDVEHSVDLLTYLLSRPILI